MVIGTEGTILVPTAFVPGHHVPLVQLQIHDGMEERTIPKVDHTNCKLNIFQIVS